MVSSIERTSPHYCYPQLARVWLFRLRLPRLSNYDIISLYYNSWMTTKGFYFLFITRYPYWHYLVYDETTNTDVIYWMRRLTQSVTNFYYLGQPALERFLCPSYAAFYLHSLTDSESLCVFYLIPRFLPHDHMEDTNLMYKQTSGRNKYTIKRNAIVGLRECSSEYETPRYYKAVDWLERWRWLSFWWR